ncbi:efflux RND transporter permease subunit [Candidatus Amoebophilus asiaticus]|nr:efflux RND transporter permease subunit [Candidatus Amoebophilus asiaticus]
MPEKKGNKKVKKEFGLSSLSVDNKSTVFVLTIIIFIMGLFSYNSMPKENFPEIVIAEIYIGISYPGNSPLDIENLITRPIEKELNTITGVDKINSTSIQDYSTIVIKFESDVAVEEALRKVKDAVDKAKKDLPSDLDQEPNIFELNFSDFPIMNINLSGDYSMDKLREYGEYLEDEIEKLHEISKVDIRGIMEKEVKIDVDVHKMEALEINFNNIANAIASENRTMSGGSVKKDNLQRTIRIVGEFSDPQEMGDVIVKHEKGNIVFLRDIAKISFDYEERQSYAREYTKPVVMLDVVKRGGENLLISSEKIMNILDKAKRTVLPANLGISVTNDQSDMTRNQLSNLENSIIFGVLLVVLVLMFFLGLRNALFVGVAIPLSMFMAFMILSFAGETLNLIVLFALILALGMLVDNGIVVVENIYRLMDEGYPPVQAAKEGVGEVALPIIASTATTLAAFLPLALWPGMMGEFMFFLPLTLMIVLGSSLFVALVINPVLTANFMRIEEKKVRKKRMNIITLGLIGGGLLFVVAGAVTFGNILMALGLVIRLNVIVLSPASKWFQQNMVPKFENGYHRFLSFALDGSKPILFFLGAFSLLIFSFFLLWIFTPKVEFFPINQPHYVNIFIEKPIGTDIEATNEFTKNIEGLVIQQMDKYQDTTAVKGVHVIKNFLVKSIIAQVGEGTSDPAQGFTMGITPHKARITVSFVEIQHRRGIRSSDVMEEIRENLRGFPGVQITVDKDAAGPPMGKPVNIEVIGENYEGLIVLAQDIKRYINEANIPGIEELKTDLELGKPELTVNIDRQKARRFGISTSQIANEIRTALFGLEISKFKQGEDDYPIKLRLAEKYRNNSEVLMNQRVTFRDQTNGKIVQVPISSVATSNNSSTYGSIKRKDLDRVVTIASNVLENHNANEVVASIKKVMRDYDLPEEFQVKFTGQQEEQAKEMSFLTRALMIAIFLIFLIIVAQFNSMGTPFIIIASVVLSMIGVLLGLIIFQMDFIIIMTMIGLISLAGVVVNNVIVLIDYTNLLMARKRMALGLAEKANLPIEELKNCLIAGGRKRLRPVLLTAITTVLGLLPLATGMNINFFTLFSEYDPQIYFGGDNVIFWGPMSWTVIFGLSFATFLTLVVVPAMYFLLNKLKYRLSRV